METVWEPSARAWKPWKPSRLFREKEYCFILKKCEGFHGFQGPVDGFHTVATQFPRFPKNSQCFCARCGRKAFCARVAFLVSGNLTVSVRPPISLFIFHPFPPWLSFSNLLCLTCFFVSPSPPFAKPAVRDWHVALVASCLPWLYRLTVSVLPLSLLVSSPFLSAPSFLRLAFSSLLPRLAFPTPSFQPSHCLDDSSPRWQDCSLQSLWYVIGMLQLMCFLISLARLYLSVHVPFSFSTSTSLSLPTCPPLALFTSLLLRARLGLHFCIPPSFSKWPLSPFDCQSLGGRG